MEPDKLMKDVDAHVQRLWELKTFLDKLYYNPEFSTVFTKPVVSFLDQACDFLIDTLNALSNKYANKKGLG